MQLNHFDPGTRLFSHSAPAMVNPKRPDEFLQQAFTTSDALPPLSENQLARRNQADTTWEVIDDNRGSAWHTRTKAEINIDQPSPLPQDYTREQPGEWDIWHNGRWQEDSQSKLKQAKQQAIRDLEALIEQNLQPHSGAVNQYQTGNWSDKARRAERILTLAATPEDHLILQLEVELRQRNETPVELAAVQLQKASRHQRKVIALDALHSHALEQIERLKNIAELDEGMEKITSELTESLIKLEQISAVPLPTPGLLTRLRAKLSRSAG